VIGHVGHGSQSVTNCYSSVSYPVFLNSVRVRYPGLWLWLEVLDVGDRVRLSVSVSRLGSGLLLALRRHGVRTPGYEKVIGYEMSGSRNNTMKD